MGSPILLTCAFLTFSALLLEGCPQTCEFGTSVSDANGNSHQVVPILASLLARTLLCFVKVCVVLIIFNLSSRSVLLAPLIYLFSAQIINLTRAYILQESSMTLRSL